MPDFTIVDVAEATPYLYIDGEASMDPADISRAMGEAFSAVGSFLENKGIAPAGPALAVYYEYDPQVMRFRAGMVVPRADLDRAAGDVKAAELPTGRALHFVHKGPYSTLREDYAVAMEKIGADGLEMGQPTWELYLNEPAETPAEELLTEVHIMLT